MGLKGSGPFFQRSVANKVLAGYATSICEIFIDDFLVHGATIWRTFVRYLFDLERRRSLQILRRLDLVLLHEALHLDHIGPLPKDAQGNNISLL